MANTTDYSRLLDGYTLLAIKGWVEGLLSYKAPLASPTFTGTVTLPTSVKIGTSTATGLVKYTNGTLSIDTNSYKTDYRYRPIQVGGTEKIGTTSSTALNFLNGTHSVQFTYSSGLYAEVNLANYKPNGTTAFLDSSNKVSASYLPDTVLGQLEYKGTWDATSTTTFTPEKGWYYICTVAGSKNPDGSASSVTYNIGDWAVYNGTSWDKVDNTDAITGIVLVSGAAKTGQVTIPAASGTAYGLIKTGYTSTGKNYKVQLDTNGNAYVNVPWVNTVTTSYGTMNFTNGLNIGDLNISVDGDTDIYNFVVPYATASEYGVVKVASVKTTAVTVNSLSTTANRFYGVEMNTDGKLFVNVPWSDTKYSADGTTLSLSGTTFSIKSGYLAAVATSGSYNDLSNKPTIPATNVIPVTTTANKVLLSTTTSGTAAWSAWSSAGFLKTNASGVVSIDTNSYALSTHTHTTTIATSSGTNQLTLAFGTKYAITAGGTSYIFTMPANPNTDHYPTAFAWTNGTEAGPTGSLTGNGGFTAVSFAAIPSASDSQSGVVTTAAQTFAGVKTFDSVIQAVAGINIGNTNSVKPIVINSSTSGNKFVRLYPTTNNSSNFDIYLPAAAGTLALTSQIPSGFTIAANATDGMFDITGTSGTNAVTYAVAPYAASVATSTWKHQVENYGKFYYGTEDPAGGANTARLNYNGSLVVGGFMAIAADSGIFLNGNYGSGGASIVIEISTRAYCGTDSKLILADGTGSAIHMCVDGAPNRSDNKFINLNTYSQGEAENILKGLNSDGTSI